MLKKYWRYFLYAALLAPFSAQADPPFVTCQGVDPATGTLGCKLTDLLDMLQNIYNWMLGFSALVALLFIIIGGIRMFYWTFMEDSEGELKAAKYTVSRAITGLIIVAVAYFIVNTFIGFLGGGDFAKVYTQGFH